MGRSEPLLACGLERRAGVDAETARRTGVRDVARGALA
jgi:hypothetical protein